MRPSAWLLWVLLSAVMVLPGCNIVGAVTAIAAPPPLVEAKHELADKPTLIVIDDRARLVNNDATLGRIAVNAATALEQEGVITAGIIGQDALSAYRADLGDQYASTSLAALGAHLGARQVIHAEVAGYQLDTGGNIVQPGIVLYVKVFDLDQLERVFPPAGESVGTAGVYALRSVMPRRDLSGQGNAARSILSRELADQAGRDLGRLFFDWRMPERGSELGQR